MIVPRNRLLIWFAVVVLPFAALGALEPVTMPLAIGLIGLFIIAALADAVGARNVLAGISLELPAISRMSKDRSASLEMRVRNQRQKQRVLRVALALPRELQSAHEDMIVALPEGSEWSRLSWECQPLKRGNFRIETAHLETVSPFGFWDVRKIAPVVSEVRVYPNLLTERKNLAALFLHRGTFGLHAQRQLGKGREFEKLREYVPGDGYDEIHWKATARRGKPITKVFQIERTQEVYVVIDASRLSARKVEKSIEKSVVSSQWSVAGDAASQATDYGLPTADSMLERFVTAALVLGLAAEQQGDLFGLLTFTDRVGKFIRAKNGKAHYSACRDALYTLQPQIVSPDYDELATFIRLRLRRRALLVFLTALDDPVLAESFVKNMDLLRRQHLLLVNMIQPPGVAEVFTNPNITSIDELYQHLGGHLLWHKLRELEKVLKRRGVRFSLLQNEKLSAELVSQYLSVKRRQLL